MTEEQKKDREQPILEGDLRDIRGPTSRRSFIKGALAGAGALAIGTTFDKGGLTRPLTAKSFATPRKTATRSGTLNFCLNGSPATIDPALANELDGCTVLFCIYDTLTKFNRTYNALEPNLATSWKSNANATEWVFKLRPNVKFTDGTPFNSTTVRDTILHFDAAGLESYFGSIKT